HNIKNIQYIDELSRRKIPFVEHLPDPIERAMRSGIETLEAYLDHLEPKMLHIAIGALLLSLLGVVALVLGTFIGLAR
ncbi:MAG: hypothetical protein OXI23_19590, partial [Gemmatimonadota bacterium]|nr:hypothetical protein [Gemmatimonadota bacterium]